MKRNMRKVCGMLLTVTLLLGGVSAVAAEEMPMAETSPGVDVSAVCEMPVPGMAVETPVPTVVEVVPVVEEIVAPAPEAVPVQEIVVPAPEPVVTPVPGPQVGETFTYKIAYEAAEGTDTVIITDRVSDALRVEKASAGGQVDGRQIRWALDVEQHGLKGRVSVTVTVLSAPIGEFYHEAKVRYQVDPVEETPAPTAEPTPVPTAEPTLAPTEAPTLAPAAEPTVIPAETPDKELTNEDAGDTTGTPAEGENARPENTPDAAVTDPAAEPARPTETPADVVATDPTDSADTQPETISDAEPTQAPALQPTEQPAENIASEPTPEPARKPAAYKIPYGAPEGTKTVVITDVLADALEVVEASAGSTAEGRTVTWTLDTATYGLSGHVTVTVALVGNLTGGALHSASVEYISAASDLANEAADGLAEETTDGSTVAPANEMPGETALEPTAALAEAFPPEESAEPARKPALYKIAYDAPEGTKAIRITDVLADALEVVEVSQGAAVDGQTVTWTLDTATYGCKGSVTLCVALTGKLTGGALHTPTLQYSFEDLPEEADSGLTTIEEEETPLAGPAPEIPRRIDIRVDALDGDKTTVVLGDAIVLTGVLTGYENTEVAYQWQCQVNGEWRDVTGETGLSYTVTLSEENADNAYRLEVTRYV